MQLPFRFIFPITLIPFSFIACSTTPHAPSVDYVRRTENQFEMKVSGGEKEPMALTYRGAFDICRIERNLGFELKQIEKQYYTPSKEEKDPTLPKLASVNSIVECTGSIDPYLNEKYTKAKDTLTRYLSNLPFSNGIELVYRTRN